MKRQRSGTLWRKSMSIFQWWKSWRKYSQFNDKIHNAWGARTRSLKQLRVPVKLKQKLQLTQVYMSLSPYLWRISWNVVCCIIIWWYLSNAPSEQRRRECNYISLNSTLRILVLQQHHNMFVLFLALPSSKTGGGLRLGKLRLCVEAFLVGWAYFGRSRQIR